MGKNLVNLGNLKQSMGLQPDVSILGGGGFSSLSQPVYIKSNSTTSNGEISNPAPVVPKFIPGVFMTPNL
jgi:hypothetical protein